MYVDPDDGGLRTWNPTGTLMSKNLPNIFVDEDDDCGDHCGQESCWKLSPKFVQNDVRRNGPLIKASPR
jgi:hypothetical protein